MNKARKKILFAITKSNFGGAQRYVYDLATSLPQDLFDIAVILGGEGILKEKLERKNIRIISLPYLGRDINLMKEFLSFKEFFMIFMREKPDIVHGNSSKGGGIAAFCARILGIRRIIFTAHAWAFNENRGFFSRSLISFLHWFNIILSHQTVAVSESVRSQVSHFPFIKGKISVVHLGIDSPDFLSRSDARKALEIPEEDLAIGTLAELHPVKGLTYAVDAISELQQEDPELSKKISYYILGEGDERGFLEKKISEKNLSGKIFLKGWKKDASLYLKSFDLFLLPSLSEALSYALLEAGYAKVPVIASQVGGIPEIITDGISGKLIQSGSKEAIAHAISGALRSPEGLERMAENLNQNVRTNFVLKRMVDKTMDIYLQGKLQ